MESVMRREETSLRVEGWRSKSVGGIGVAGLVGIEGLTGAGAGFGFLFGFVVALST
jgi:hypothetical protein